MLLLGVMFPGGGARMPKTNAAHPRSMRGTLHSLSCHRSDVFLDLLISGARKNMKLGLLTLMICLLSAPLRAELRLTSVITDHGVLQRDTPIHVWGEASPAETITITFHGQSIATV